MDGPLQGQAAQGGGGEEALDLEGREGGQKGGIQVEDGEGALGPGEGDVREDDGAVALDCEGRQGSTQVVIQTIGTLLYLKRVNADSNETYE